MSANIGIKLMAVAVILAMANLLSGYYGLRSPGVFVHSLECAHDILVRDFALYLALSGADYDVVDREDASQLSVIADDRKPRRLLTPHGFERGAYVLVQREGVNIPRHHLAHIDLKGNRRRSYPQYGFGILAWNPPPSS